MQTAERISDTHLPAIPMRRPMDVRVVEDVIPVLDTARFEHMQRVAAVMARCSLIPDGLKADSEMQTAANCFLVVNQAVGWGMDPFSVAQCVSVIKGKLLHEGKLIAAVIEQKLGIKLKKEWKGDGDRMSIVVSGTFADGTTETVEGSVAEWKTTGSNTPWVPKQYRKMLWYRGAREWCRLHAPGLILGIYAPDELDEFADDARADAGPPVSIEPPTPPDVLEAKPEIVTGETLAAEPARNAPDVATAGTTIPANAITPATTGNAPVASEPPSPPEVMTAPMIAPSSDAMPDIPGFLKRGAAGKKGTPDQKPASTAAKPDETKRALDEERWLRGFSVDVEAKTPAELKDIWEQYVMPKRDVLTPETWSKAVDIFKRAKHAAEEREKAKPAAFDVAQWLRDLEGAASGCTTAAEVFDVQKTIQKPAHGKVNKEDYARGKKIIDEALRRIADSEDDE